MFEELFRSLVPPQGAFTPEQMAEFRRQAASLPAAPSGQFFQVPANSPDRQAGQLLPLVNGQPVPEMAPIVGESDGRLGLRGAMGITPPPAMAGVSPIGVQAPPPPPPKDVFSPPSALGAMVPGLNPKSGPDDEQRWFDARGGMTTQQARADTLSRDPMMAARFDLERTMKANAPPPPAGSPEDIVRRALAFRDQVRNETSPMEGGYQAGRGYAGHIDRSNEAMRLLLGIQGQQMQQADRMQLQALENQGRMDVADASTKQHQLSELDRSELRIREAVEAGKYDRAQGQAMIDTINARRQTLVSPSSRSPDGPAGGAAPPSPLASPPLTSGQDIEALRHLFGTTNPQTGDFAPDMSRIGNFLGGIKPEQIPQVASAIKSGRFGKNTAALEEALYRSAGRDWQLSAGVGSGQQSSPLDNAEYRYGFQFGGDPAAGRNPQQLFQLARVPGSTALSRAWQGVPEALSGSFINKIVLPDGKMIDLEDNFNPFGMVDRSKAVGEASRRLPLTAALIAELQKKGVQPPPALRPVR